MKLNFTLPSLIAFLSVSAPVHAESPASKTITISAYDTMKYSVTTIEAQAGQRLTIELKNEGTLPKEAMGHNWILLKAGTNVPAYVSAAMTARTDNYAPKAFADKVLASIPLLGPKEAAKVTFTVPTAPGNYIYLCSFPGHQQAGMTGILVVK
jgi:azurin